MQDFVHLHVHSHYSLLDGLGKIPDLVSRCKELGMDTIALTDHGVMYGAIEFYKECQKQGIKPIIGTEMYISPRKMTDKESGIDSKPYHLVLLCKNHTGYQNLLKIVTTAHLEGYYYRPRVDKEYLKKHAEGLIALTACGGGEIPKASLSGSKEKLIKTIKEYQDIFGDDLYLELQHHPEFADQVKINQKLKAIAKELNIPLVATNDAHYIHEDDKEAHEVLLAVQTGKDYDDENRMTLKEFNLSLIPPDEMTKNFADVPDAIENTRKIADMCNLEIELGQTILPKFPVPEKETAKSYLEKLCHEGAKNRYGKISPEVKERLDYELSVIEKCHFEDYFLMVSDYVNFAKDSGILVGPGRGSAAGSIVAYVLEITDLDPLYYELLFERFLNPERISPPDIDLDFADDRRAEVIQYIMKKYGADHVSQIITFGVMKARMAIRDVARALGMSYEDGDRIAKLIPLGVNLTEAMETISELQDIYKNELSFTRLIDMAKRLENVARNAGTHAAGVVISQKPLVEYVPLQHPPRDDTNLVTQYSMNYLENIGLLKVDILGLSNLSIINNTLRIIRKVNDTDLDLTKIPMDDKKTFSLLAKAETSGVFQIESEGMKRYLKDLKPTTFEDIISMVALYRPGPIDSIPDFIDSKHGRKKITYLDPKLEPILASTYGVIVTQDQVLQIARHFAGFTYGEADILRKAVGKKIQKLLDEQKEKFLAGAVKNGATAKTAQAVWDFIEPFARYGFNRAHAACYAMISYQTAYLKAHYPSAFMAAWLTSEQQNIDKVAYAMTEAKRMKIEVLPPDVNESFVEFGVVKATGNIRFGLAAIKNVGAGVSEQIAEERKVNGPYTTITDFFVRLGSKVLNKKVIEALAKTGAFDNLAERNQVLLNIDIITKFLQGMDKSTSRNQMDLFSNTVVKPAKVELNLQTVPPADERTRLAWEKELLGVYISEHPLTSMAKTIAKNGIPIESLKGKAKEQNVQIAGIITNSKKITTKKNEPMVFINLEDPTGSIEIVVFPRVYETGKNLFDKDRFVIIQGRIDNKDGIVKLIATKAESLNEDSSETSTPTKLIINLEKDTSKTILNNIKTILIKYPGELAVTLRIGQNGNGQSIKTKTTVSNDKKLLAELKELLPDNKIYLD